MSINHGSIYAIGEVIPEFRGHADGPQIDVADDGAWMYVFLNKPTQEEIAAFAHGNYFEIRFTPFSDTIIFTAKIGNLNWIDAPYTPHLAKPAPLLQFEKTPGFGLGLKLMLIDTATGEIKQMRLLGLSEAFTDDLLKEINQLAERPFSGKQEYEQMVQQIFARYDTVQIAKMSKSYCKIG